VKTASSKRHHILFAAGNKKRVAFGRQLFQPETVTVEQQTAVQKTDFRLRAIDFDMLFYANNYLSKSLVFRKIVVPLSSGFMQTEGSQR
jgi:hypothetical protein